MKFFYVIANSTREGALTTAGFIRDYLENLGIACVVDAGTPRLDRDGYTYREQVSPQVDCIIVLGGDGTLLQAAVDLAELDIPFLGINMGTLGFLTEVNKDGIKSALEKLIREEFTIEKRMMLLGRSYEAETVKDETRALNDIVITRRGSLQIINFNIYVNGQLLHRFHGDGVIVATPTGSTGYSLSAGGPIVEPKAELILLTPICPHSMHNRSIVLSSKDRVTVEIESSRDGETQEVEAIFDGCHKVLLRTGEKIEIRKSQKTTGIVKLSQVSFLEVLHRKLSD
ncbi:MAG: NAD(+)/NADH kinase [Lachnospiraceae bacterium]|nr:NAD(+)/NADH kinase [Lachnospiraceae bacterium]MCI9333338.1 NAD(+)/NADH kinase [Lachnospiraceae bacterium]